MDITYDSIKALYAEKGFPFYKTPMNINIFGIRQSLDVDMWNDTIGLAYTDDNGKNIVMPRIGTTKPGLYYLKNKLGNVKGTFILMPGYYGGCWRMGLHKGQYRALVQSKAGVFKGWRDSDSDGKLDMNGPIYHDVQGLNLHTTSHIRGTANAVGAYSASCQVLRLTKDHDEFMEIADISMNRYGPLVSYGLFDEVE